MTVELPSLSCYTKITGAAAPSNLREEILILKLSPDCVRDILITVEDCSFGEYLNLEKLSERLPEYSQEDLWYTCIKLDEGGFLDITTIPILRSPLPGIKSINNLTFYGHEFLNNIREESNWNKVKSVGKKVGSSSLNTLGDIAKTVIATSISAVLQQHL